MDDQILLTEETISNKIYFIRNQKVMLDSDLAMLYGVETKRLNEQVKRNLSRFPEDFMFQLTENEYDSLRSQIATLKKGRGAHQKYLPFVFTEHGILMLSSVLKSDKAIQTNI
ncbi:ORF6N domain-containing protein [Flavobacterium sp. ENC]|uniref:ORF6N domain-containing protein n=1 Tax=Flavobacterium sp. ENC TaxID=2897330 RepID=UPI001E2F8BA5|nr:ORF6N domain-containing protein [Flavobacterium sp. ENC]MCD0464361.1 ORF6N domain-containing protein [Flavobacterium sp. ENC]